MLPIPGAPASSWSLYKARAKSLFEGADARVCTAFWVRLKGIMPCETPADLCPLLLVAVRYASPTPTSTQTQTLTEQPAGLINNILYVIILSAALDLVGPSVPKATVLLADVIPSFLTKLTAPYYIHAVPY